MGMAFFFSIKTDDAEKEKLNREQLQKQQQPSLSYASALGEGNSIVKPLSSFRPYPPHSSSKDTEDSGGVVIGHRVHDSLNTSWKSESTYIISDSKTVLPEFMPEDTPTGSTMAQPSPAAQTYESAEFMSEPPSPQPGHITKSCDTSHDLERGTDAGSVIPRQAACIPLTSCLSTSSLIRSPSALSLRKHRLTDQDADGSFENLSRCSSAQSMVNGIEEVDFSKNRLSRLPQTIGSLAMSLTRLNMSNNQFNVIPIEVLELRRLEVLIVENNQIDQPFPRGFTQAMSKLRVLRASGNRIPALPERIELLHSLASLQMGSVTGGNCISHLPSSIGLLAGTLRDLDLSNNHLTCLPNEMGRLVHLRTLILTNNRLEHLPDLGRLRQLQDLNVSQNDLYLLPPSLAKLRQLRSLDASRNAICAVTAEISESLKYHTVVLLAGNPFLQESPYGEAMNRRLREEGAVPFKHVLKTIDPNREDVWCEETEEAPRVPTLVEFCARTIIQHNIPYIQDDDNDASCSRSNSRISLLSEEGDGKHVLYLLPERMRAYLRKEPITCAGCNCPCIQSYQPCVKLGDCLGHRGVPTYVNFCSLACRHAIPTPTEENGTSARVPSLRRFSTSNEELSSSSASSSRLPTPDIEDGPLPCRSFPPSSHEEEFRIISRHFASTQTPSSSTTSMPGLSSLF